MLDCLNEMLKREGLANRLDNDVWNRGGEAVVKGVQDRDKSARESAIECFKTINQYKKDLADDLVEKMPKREQNACNKSRG